MTEKYKTVRAVVEVRVPERITEKQLVHKLEELIKWPIQLGYQRDHETLVKPKFKQFSRVYAYMRRTEPSQMFLRFSDMFRRKSTQER
jgi:tRNA U38,U39,U40 pseudouridine synthase TruA